MSVISLLFCCYAVISLGWDLHSRKLPNRWIAAGLFTAVMLHLWFDGWSGLWMSALGGVMGIAFAYPLWAVGAIGAGDAKWFFTAGAWVGGIPAGIILLLAILLSGLAAVIYVIFSRRSRERCKTLFFLVMSFLTVPSMGNIVRVLSEYNKQGGRRFPFMVAVIPSICLVFAMQWVHPELLEGWR